MYKILLSSRTSPWLFASLNFKREALHINRISSSHHFHFTSRHCTSSHLPYLHASLHVTSQSPLEFTLLVTVFLTLFLKVLNKHGKDASKPAGNCLQLVIVIFTNEYLPIPLLCFLVLILRLWSSVLRRTKRNLKCVYVLNVKQRRDVGPHVQLDYVNATAQL